MTPLEDSLGAFQNVVEAEFAFLKERGFRSTADSSNSVLYSGSPRTVFVRVFYDPREQYVGFQVGLDARPRDALSKEEIASLAGDASWRRPNAHEESGDRLRGGVARAAALLRSCGERALSGDESVFDEAMEVRRASMERRTTGDPTE